MFKKIAVICLAILILSAQGIRAENTGSGETSETQETAHAVIPEQQGTATLADIEKHGNVTLSITCQEFLDAGYKFGDIVTVSFLDRSVDIPFCSDYFGVDSGNPVLVAKDGEPNIKLAICLGNFAGTYGIADKHIQEDESVTWTWADGVVEPVEFMISMKEPGGYYGMYIAHLMEYTDVRSDYPDLTDEQYANFRNIATTGVGQDRLYRTASPVNPERNRNMYADAALAKHKVTVILNLVDDEATLQSYEGYSETYYATVKHLAINLSFDYTTPEMEAKLLKGLRFFAENEGIYAIHCTEGKNRTGYVSALLECFMGASCEEVVSDYMTTYYNYFGLTRDDDRYDTIADGNIVKPLEALFGVDDLENADLKACAETYFRQIGLTDEEVTALRNHLAGQFD